MWIGILLLLLSRLGFSSVVDRLAEVVLQEVGPSIRVEISRLSPSCARLKRDLRLSNTPFRGGIVGFLGRGSVQVGEDSENELKCTATAKLYAKVGVAKRELEHREPLDADRIDFKERELTQLNQSGYFLSLSELTDRRVRGRIRVGAPLNLQNTERMKWVESNTPIQVTLERPGYRIRAQMKALESGEKNSWIRVQNPQTRKQFLARVTGKGEAEVR